MSLASESLISIKKVPNTCAVASLVNMAKFGIHKNWQIWQVWYPTLAAKSFYKLKCIFSYEVKRPNGRTCELPPVWKMILALPNLYEYLSEFVKTMPSLVKDV